MRHVLTLFDLTSEETEEIFALTEDLKTKLAQGIREPLLPGRVLALLFEKQSLRTRVSFETAMTHLGGNSLFLGKDVGWGERESVADFGHVLGEYVDAVACRANSHAKVEALAAHCGRPVINALTDTSHPCQALADLYTIRELRGSLAGLRLAYVGDANNVACSLAVACGRLDVEFTIAAPDGYQLGADFVAQLEREIPTMRLVQTTDPSEAVSGAVAVYTDVWTSMGQESEREERARALADYQVNVQLMKQAASDDCFLHCLPARRGEEVTAEVIDGPQSAIVQQAGNRLHAQKGLLAWLLR
jgi:ornithine carbamoyltransferase